MEALSRNSMAGIHAEIVRVLSPVLPSGATAATDAIMDDASNAARARIMALLPVDPESGIPIPQQYQHRGAVVEFPSEDGGLPSRDRGVEYTALQVVLHLMYRVKPQDQQGSTYAFWTWEEAIRGQIQGAATLRAYRPRYSGTRRGRSTASAEWLTAAVTFTFQRATFGG